MEVFYLMACESSLTDAAIIISMLFKLFRMRLLSILIIPIYLESLSIGRTHCAGPPNLWLLRKVLNFLCNALMQFPYKAPFWTFENPSRKTIIKCMEFCASKLSGMPLALCNKCCCIRSQRSSSFPVRFRPRKSSSLINRSIKLSVSSLVLGSKSMEEQLLVFTFLVGLV
jgi:hypothetical protein